MRITAGHTITRGARAVCGGDRTLVHGALAVLAAALLAGCAARTGRAPGENSSLRYLALGDSYTIGESVPPAERWPVVLAARLRSEGLAVAEPEIVARTGWTTDELSEGIDRAAPRGPYDLVTLLIGVNDQYRGADAAAYAPKFAALLDRAIAFAGGRPERAVVVSIPDWGVTPYAEGRDRAQIGAAIDRFNAENRAAAERARVAWVDVTSISRRPGSRERLADDGLHPSGAMYREWVEAVLPAARQAVRVETR